MVDEAFVQYFVRELQSGRHYLSDRQLAQAFSNDKAIEAIAEFIGLAFPPGDTTPIGDDSVRWEFRDHRVTRSRLGPLGFDKVAEFSLFTRTLLASRLSGYGGKIALERIACALADRGLSFATDGDDATARRLKHYGQAGRIPVRIALLDVAGFGGHAFTLEGRGIDKLGMLALRTRSELQKLTWKRSGKRVLRDEEIDTLDIMLHRYDLAISQEYRHSQDIHFAVSG